MKLSIALAASLFFLPLLVDAQYGPPPAPDPTTSETGTPTSSGTPTSTSTPSSPSPASNSSTITVQVAPGDQLTYGPTNFTAGNGTTVTFVFPSAINAPTSGNTYAAYLSAAKALGSNEKPISDSGPVTGGVGAVATGTPVVGAAGSSNTTSSKTSSSSSSAGQLVANGFFALLATAFGITLA
ncbi:hypothetical protein BC826DRAFT_1108089 [Russula brevipes]|nr:hypothetical protein BC826DRAFT_1108089 [Russula brevipes]